MEIELICCTSVLLAEINTHKLSQKEVAKTYRLALQSFEETDRKEVNQAIINRWSLSGLDRIKKMAWSGKCFE